MCVGGCPCRCVHIYIQVHMCKPEDLPQSYLLNKWVAPFPKQEFLNSVIEEKANWKGGREGEGGRYRFVYFLSAPDRGCEVTSGLGSCLDFVRDDGLSPDVVSQIDPPHIHVSVCRGIFITVTETNLGQFHSEPWIEIKCLKVSRPLGRNVWWAI